jgi:hypothetical protein
MICTKFVPLERGALRGFADLELDSGLVIHDARLMESSGKRWVNLPGKPQLDRDKNLVRGANGMISLEQHTAAVERACAADRAWFDAHPGHGSYLRAPFPGEIFGQDCNTVKVVEIGPGVRMRIPCAWPAGGGSA